MTVEDRIGCLEKSNAEMIRLFKRVRIVVGVMLLIDLWRWIP